MPKRMRDWLRKHGGFVVIMAALAAAQVVVLHWADRPWICSCGYLKLWHGTAEGVGNSQHLFDPYDFGHALHGVAFYVVLYVFMGRRPIRERLVVAMLMEIAWEWYENVPFAFAWRRAQLAEETGGYMGDSIANSIVDLGAMMTGFWIVARWRFWKAAAAVAILGLLFLAGYYRGLSPSLIILLHPLDIVRTR